MRQHLVRIERDLAPLGQRAQAACSGVLDAIEHAPTLVRRHVRVELIDGDFFVVSGGWRLHFGADPQRLSVAVLSSPRTDQGRRRAIAESHTCSLLEAEHWLAWIFQLVTTSGPGWPTLPEFHRLDLRGKP